MTSLHTAVITGAASGIGRALALALVEHNSTRNIALCDVNTHDLDELCTALRSKGATVWTQRVDVSQRDQVEDFAQNVLDRFGPPDLLVNNAGVALSQTIQEMTYEDLEWITGINYWGVVYGTKSFLPAMTAAKKGHIVNISSIFGIISLPTQGAYNATKFAVRGFTEALRQELHNTGVRASCVHPGGIRTNIARSARFHVDLNGSSDPLRAARDFDRVAYTTSEEAAAQILQGVRAQRERILIGPDARLLDIAQRIAPTRYDRIIRTFSKLKADPTLQPTYSPKRPDRLLRPLFKTLASVIPSPPPSPSGSRVDPAYGALMTLYETLAPLSFHNHPVPKARALYARSQRLLLGPVETVQSVRDLTVQGAEGPLSARLYTPTHANPQHPTPLLIWYHGGGFVVGNIKLYDRLARHIAQHLNVRVLLPSYRLAPEHPYPAAWNDALAIYQHAQNHAASWNVRPDQIAVAGDSAGGNLAASVSMRACTTPNVTPPGYQWLVYPVLDLTHTSQSRKTFGRGYLLNREMLDWFDTHCIQPHQRPEPLGSVLKAPNIPANLPPARLLTAEFDPLVDDCADYAKRLRDAGLDARITQGTGMAHGFVLHTGAIEAARRVLDTAIRDVEWDLTKLGWLKP